MPKLCNQSDLVAAAAEGADGLRVLSERYPRDPSVLEALMLAFGSKSDTLIEAVETHRPDIAVIDIRMPPDFTHEGAEAAVQLRADHPDLAILLLSQAIETHFAAQLFEKHGERFGYLLKDRVVDVSTLMHSLHTIAAGGTVLDPEIARRMMHVHAASHPVLALSDRERDVLGLMAEGRSNAAIADRLVVSLKTVDGESKIYLNDIRTS